MEDSHGERAAVSSATTAVVARNTDAALRRDGRDQGDEAAAGVVGGVSPATTAVDDGSQTVRKCAEPAHCD